MKLGPTLNDLLTGLTSVKIWWRLSLLTRKEQHKRSILGPVWNTIGSLVLILLFGVLYAPLLDYGIESHLPYVASGIVIWIFYSDILTKSCSVFIAHAVFIQQLTLPKSIYLYRIVATEVINLAYTFFLILLPILIWANLLSWNLIVALASFVLIMINAFTVSIVLSVISLRFSDVAPLVANIMRPLMFVTPIIWTADKFSDRAIFIHLNPFFHMVEIFRAPLLGKDIPLESLTFMLIATCITTITAIFVFARYRSRIAYWV